MTSLTILGTGRWPRHLATLIEAHSDVACAPIDIRERRWAMALVRSRGSILRVGLRPGASNRNGRVFDMVFRALTVLQRRNFAVYWIGSDVSDSLQSDDHVPAWAADVEHWTGAPWFVDELRPLGVVAQNVWFPSAAPLPAGDPPPLPNDGFRVSAYVPATRPELYGWTFLCNVAELLPTIEFRVFGDGCERLIGPPNMTMLGAVPDGAAEIENCVVHLRPTEHDALAGTVREALALGRHVGFTHPFEGAHLIDRGQPDRTAAWIHDLVRQYDEGTLDANRIGHSSLRHLFDTEMGIDRFIDHVQRLVGASK